MSLIKHCASPFGFLDITLGCLFSGKTTRLIVNEYHELKENQSVLCVSVNHGLDKRYNDGSMLSSHDKQEVPCILIDDLHQQWYYRESEYYSALILIGVSIYALLPTLYF